MRPIIAEHPGNVTWGALWHMSRASTCERGRAPGADSGGLGRERVRLTTALQTFLPLCRTQPMQYTAVEIALLRLHKRLPLLARLLTTSS